METTCACCNKTKDKISRILYSKEECELQVIFYYKLPTEMIRTIGEYLYQPVLIKINHKIKKQNPLWLQYNKENKPSYNLDEKKNIIMEDNVKYNCSSCFLYNFIFYRKHNPNIMPRLRSHIHWFNNILVKKEIVLLFEEYFGDIFKFKLPSSYNMYFYRSFGLTLVKNNGETLEDFEKQQTIENNNNKIFNNDEIIKIIIPDK